MLSDRRSSSLTPVPATPVSLWAALPRPIIGLAPMDGISDQPFRHISKRYGEPAVIYTEFTSVEELCRGKRHRTLRTFLYDESQRPVVAQVYGQTPELFRQVAILVCALGFDGIDINMGCPAKSIAAAGAGAGLIRTPALAQSLIRAVKQGVADWCNGATPADCAELHPDIVDECARRRAALPPAQQIRRALPVSVKTRIGLDRPAVAAWIPALLAAEPVAIALHGRTLVQAYRGDVDWEAIGQAAVLAQPTATLLLGNGDIASWEEAQRRITELRLDGALIGRAALGNPFVLRSPTRRLATLPAATLADSLLWVALEHAQLFADTFGQEPFYRFTPMRKHLKAYCHAAGASAATWAFLAKAETAKEVADTFGLPRPAASQPLTMASEVALHG